MSNVKFFIDARRILSVKHKKNNKFCYLLKMKPEANLKFQTFVNPKVKPTSHP